MNIVSTIENLKAQNILLGADELSSLSPKLVDAISVEINKRANLNRQIRAIFAIA